MSLWTDQMPFAGVTLASWYTEGRSWEIERGTHCYRLTGGNLFGSQSLLFTSAEGVLRCLGLLLKHPSPAALNEIMALPGFLGVEPRPAGGDSRPTDNSHTKGDLT